MKTMSCKKAFTLIELQRFKLELWVQPPSRIRAPTAQSEKPCCGADPADLFLDLQAIENLIRSNPQCRVSEVVFGKLQVAFDTNLWA